MKYHRHNLEVFKNLQKVCSPELEVHIRGQPGIHYQTKKWLWGQEKSTRALAG